MRSRIRLCAVIPLMLAGCGTSGGGFYFTPMGDGGGAIGGGDDAAMSLPPDLAEPASPCGNVPETGVCATPTRIDRCVTPSGQGQPMVVSQTCKSWETCAVTNGVALCALKPGACNPGKEECTGPNTRRTCVQGAWQTSNCAGCQVTQFGTTCSGGATTRTFTGVFKYEVRGPNQGWTDWSANVFVAPAQGALVVSYVHDNAKNTDTALDVATTDQNGNFSIKVPTTPGVNDVIVIWAVRPAQGGLDAGISFAVASPDVPDGEWNVGTPIPGGNDAYFWGWGYYTRGLGANGSTITIREADGSGAFRIFDYLRYIYNSMESLTGTSGNPLLVWVRPNTSWSCGACQAARPYSLQGYDFDAQIWIPATAQDQSYWSDAVNAHEIGHWVMGSYGTSPGEGGPHTEACPTYPGQAWSEGWATGFSSLARASGRYYDKQDGTFFWLDIDRRVYGDGAAWRRPLAQNGLLQLIDENEVAAMLWALASNPNNPNLSLSSNTAFFDALQSRRMNTSPYLRGYTQHTWSGACQRTNVVDTRRSVPMLADFLDALVCAGMPAARVDAVTDPLNRYPYPSRSPLCR